MSRADERRRARRVHVVGCHRSGTTLLAQLLWYGFRFDARAEHEASLFNTMPHGVDLYLSKKPPDTVRINRVFLKDPDLFVIAMIRDPRSVITSRHQRRPDAYFSSFWRWEYYLRAIQAVESHPRYLSLRYEDLIREPNLVQQCIGERLRFLERRRAFADYPDGANVSTKARISLNGVRRIDAGEAEPWRRDLGRVKAELARHPSLATWLVRLGYEKNDEWTRFLDGVSPTPQTYKSERPHLLRRAETAARYALKRLRYSYARGLPLF
jgi:hypothetical protein